METLLNILLLAAILPSALYTLGAMLEMIGEGLDKVGLAMSNKGRAMQKRKP